MRNSEAEPITKPQLIKNAPAKRVTFTGHNIAEVKQVIEEGISVGDVIIKNALHPEYEPFDSEKNPKP